jgi:hypothetical protein
MSEGFVWRKRDFTWAKWIAALDKLELLKPRAVISGHKRPDNDDHPRIIEETRSYFRDFLGLNEETTTVREFFDRMMKLHGIERIPVRSGAELRPPRRTKAQRPLRLEGRGGLGNHDIMLHL